MHETISLRESLYYLPPDILKWCSENVVYFSTCSFKTGSRLSRGVCESKEIILLSEKIFPVKFEKSDIATRFLIFIVLHETAHAHLKHRCRCYDHLTPEEIELQEQEATSLAVEWYNLHGNTLALPVLEISEITTYEIKVNQLIESWDHIWKNYLSGK